MLLDVGTWGRWTVSVDAFDTQHIRLHMAFWTRVFVVVMTGSLFSQDKKPWMALSKECDKIFGLVDGGWLGRVSTILHLHAPYTHQDTRAFSFCYLVICVFFACISLSFLGLICCCEQDSNMS